jgi:tetratricopeptide (TPR) repeat protein
VQKGFPRLLVAFVSITLGGAWAQDSAAAIVKGEVQSEIPLFGHVVELHDLQSHQKSAVQDIASDGSFEFHDLRFGDYEIQVSNRAGSVLYDSFISVSERSGAIVVTLPHREVNRPPSGPVSVGELMHPPSRKAVQSMVAAQKLSEAGNHAAAAAELQKAVLLAPASGTAHTNLAVQYIRLLRYPEALDELQRAGQLVKPTALILGNTAYAQLALGRDDEAMQSLRKAVELDASYAPAQYLLGVMLARDAVTRREAIAHLELAAGSLAGARVALEQVRRELGAEESHEEK